MTWAFVVADSRHSEIRVTLSVRKEANRIGSLATESRLGRKTKRDGIVKTNHLPELSVTDCPSVLEIAALVPHCRLKHDLAGSFLQVGSAEARLTHRSCVCFPRVTRGRPDCPSCPLAFNISQDGALPAVVRQSGC
jgi:hypothetical protein